MKDLEPQSNNTDSETISGNSWWNEGVRYLPTTALALVVAFIPPSCVSKYLNMGDVPPQERNVEVWSYDPKKVVVPTAKPFSARDEILRVHRQGLLTPEPHRP